MQQIQYSFKRYEKKYLLTKEQLRSLYGRLLEKMREDEFGIHSVCSIYYDTDTYELARKSIEKPVYKEKFRVRCYGMPSSDSMIYAEIKKKFDGIVYKRRVASDAAGISGFLAGRTSLSGEEQIQREIRWFLQKYRPEPKVFIAYERIALEAKDGSGLRVTFDWNIRWRRDRLHLADGMRGEPVLPDGGIVMEIKVPEAMPLWMADLLSAYRIYPASFSKYGTCYCRYLSRESAADTENQKLGFQKEEAVC